MSFSFFPQQQPKARFDPAQQQLFFALSLFVSLWCQCVGVCVEKILLIVGSNTVAKSPIFFPMSTHGNMRQFELFCPTVYHSNQNAAGIVYSRKCCCKMISLFSRVSCCCRLFMSCLITIYMPQEIMWNWCHLAAHKQGNLYAQQFAWKWRHITLLPMYKRVKKYSTQRLL